MPRTSSSQRRRSEQHSTRCLVFPSRQNSSSTTPYICSDCRRIDVAGVMSPYSQSERTRRRYKVPLDLSYVNSDSDCELCRFLLKMQPGDPDLRSLKGFQLRAYSAQKRLVGVARMGTLDDRKLLAVVPKGARSTTLKNQRSVFTVQKLFTVQRCDGNDRQYVLGFKDTSADIDWDGIKSILAFCQDHHHNLCHRSMPVPQLTVIDCDDRKIVQLPTDQTAYVTLSYVWGLAHPVEETINGTLGILPRTIDDAISVVQSMGFKYLWVDRYCIPQQDEVEKTRLIDHMGHIYKNSVLTIIAAMGTGPDCGLPGITPGLRSTPTPFSVNGWSFVGQDLSVNIDIQQSTWNSRGWTFQEGLLSTRKLIFSSRQLYFQCNAMHCLEGTDVELHRLHTKDLQRMLDKTEIPRALPNEGTGATAVDLLDRITEFGARRLTNNNDVLRAFQGILQDFAPLDEVNAVISGLPIFSFDVYRRKWLRTEFDFEDRLAHALMWELPNRPGKDENLGMERRTGFPSWTWAGWSADHEFFHPHGLRIRHELSHCRSSLASFALQFSDGDSINCQDSLETIRVIQEKQGLHHDVKYIHIRANALNVEWLGHEKGQDSWHNSQVRLRS